MTLDGACAYPEPGGDLGIGKPAGDEIGDVPLSLGQARPSERRPPPRAPPPAGHRGGFLDAEPGTALPCGLRLRAEILAPGCDPARDPAGLHRPCGETQLLAGGASGRQQRQSAPGVPLINEQTTQGLQRFDQAQTVAGLELPRPAPRGSC